ncbi:hypothetical protein PG989_010782 [Apiospora arundinis]
MSQTSHDSLITVEEIKKGKPKDPTMTDNWHKQYFEKPLGEFNDSMKYYKVGSFRTTTLEQFRGRIEALGTTQKRRQELKRLEPFLLAIWQYEKVVSTFYRNDGLVASIYAFPLLLQYQRVCVAKPQLVSVLALLYEDITNFQSILLRYFLQPMWQAMFSESESWKTCKSRFRDTIRNIAQRGNFIESQAYGN